MGTSSARPDDLDRFAGRSRNADDALRDHKPAPAQHVRRLPGRDRVGRARHPLDARRLRHVHRVQRDRRAVGGARSRTRSGAPAATARSRRCRTRRSTPACGPRACSAAASRSRSTIPSPTACRRRPATPTIRSTPRAATSSSSRTTCPSHGLTAGLTLRADVQQPLGPLRRVRDRLVVVGRRPPAPAPGRRRVRRPRRPARAVPAHGRRLRARAGRRRARRAGRRPGSC